MKSATQRDRSFAYLVAQRNHDDPIYLGAIIVAFAPSPYRLRKENRAARGAVGLWSLKSTVGSSPAGYADELMRMVDAIGPEHVMIGTDIDGIFKNGRTMEGLGDLRNVADVLRERGVDDKTLRAICFENYARCLRTALQSRRAREGG